MKKNYKELDTFFGNLDGAIKELNRCKLNGELIYINFNGEKLYSDVDDEDSAYKKITGKTKAEFDEAQKKRHEEYQEQERKHKEAIPKLTEEWIEKGKAILDEEYMDDWIKCVPIRLGDLYKGMELGATLEIIKELNEGCELPIAKKIIEDQGHSGMSFGLVRNMVYYFCKRGKEFADYVQ
jgi:hypothetical protein